MSTKNCGHSVPCGCGDKALTTPPSSTTGACAGEPCSEIFCQECVAQCQESYAMVIGGFNFNVAKGERLDEIVQRLLVALADPDGMEFAAVGLRLVATTDEGFTITWSGLDTETYTLYHKKGVEADVTQAVVAGVYKATVTGLLADTEYVVWLKTAGNFESVKMTIKTNA